MKKSNRSKFIVKGLNQERTINSIIKKIKIYNLKRLRHDLSEFEVDYVHHKKLSKILQESGLQVEEVSHHGFLSLAKKIITSYGLIAALVLSSILYAFQYNFILKIDVIGGQDVEISRFVKKSLKSRYKSKIDTQKLEIAIKDKFENVSSVSVAIVGQSLIVNINPAVIPDEMEEGKEIKSNFDGLITDIKLVQGTLAVENGDIVKKGDVLVYPYIIDSQGQQREVTAKAEIYADVWLTSSEMFYDYSIVTVRTGKKIKRNEIYLKSLLLYSNKKQIPFKEYEVEESESELTKNNLLPLKRKTFVYYETQTKEIYQDFSLQKDEVIEKARAKSLIFLEKDEIIKEENCIIRDSGSIHEVEYVITVNRNIGG